LCPGLHQAVKNRSGTVHSMLYQKDILLDLHKNCEKNHNTEFWKAFCRQIDQKLIHNQYAYQILLCSEQEVYFNYAFNLFPHRVKERRLATADISDSFDKINNHIDDFKNKGFASISFHHWFQIEYKDKIVLNQPEYVDMH
jgi:L-2-hydroxyglutarate oxidase LhgO